MQNMHTYFDIHWLSLIKVLIKNINILFTVKEIQASL